METLVGFRHREMNAGLDRRLELLLALGDDLEIGVGTQCRRKASVHTLSDIQRLDIFGERPDFDRRDDSTAIGQSDHQTFARQADQRLTDGGARHVRSAWCAGRLHLPAGA